MSTHQWQYDAPTGVYKNHKLSSQLREASIAQTQFMQFVRPEDGYGKKMGESITITRISNISVPTSSVLVENDPIPEDNVTLSTQAITVSEHGRAVPFTSFSQDLAHIDLRNAIQRQLVRQMSLSLDITAATAAKAGQVTAIPDGIASITFDTDGTASTTATKAPALYHIEQIRDYMYSTLNIEPMPDGKYVGILATKSKRSLMSDPSWQDWKKYTDPEAKYNSEVGMIEDIRLIETNHGSALTNGVGTNSVLGEGVFFGDDALVMAVAEDPELRAEIPKDFGRRQSVAWYGVYAMGQVWSDSATAGEARVIYMTSA